MALIESKPSADHIHEPKTAILQTETEIKRPSTASKVNGVNKKLDKSAKPHNASKRKVFPNSKIPFPPKTNSLTRTFRYQNSGIPMTKSFRKATPTSPKVVLPLREESDLVTELKFQTKSTALKVNNTRTSNTTKVSKQVLNLSTQKPSEVKTQEENTPKKTGQRALLSSVKLFNGCYYLRPRTAAATIILEHGRSLTKSNISSLTKSNISSRTKSRISSRTKPKISSRTTSNISSRTKSKISSRTKLNISSRTKSKIISRTKSKISSRTKSNISSGTKSNISSRTKSNISSRTKPNISSRTKPNISSRKKSNISSRTKSNISSRKKSNISYRTKSNISHRTKPNKSSQANNEAKKSAKPCYANQRKEFPNSKIPFPPKTNSETSGTKNLEFQ